MANIAPHFPGFGVAADGWNPTELTSNVPIELDTYNHIVGVYSITDNMLRIYVNGKEEGTAAGPGGLAISNSDVLIGAFRYTITSGRIERYINGILDDVRIYNRALSKSEILELYSKTLFVDVPPGHWAEESIYKIYEAGITTGCSQNPLKYCPQADVTRAQMAAFIVRAVEGEPAANYCGTGSPFSDVSPASYFCKYIKRLLELGITKGCGGGKYCPKANVTREQMAAFLARAFLGMD